MANIIPYSERPLPRHGFHDHYGHYPASPPIAPRSHFFDRSRQTPSSPTRDWKSVMRADMEDRSDSGNSTRLFQPAHPREGAAVDDKGEQGTLQCREVRGEREASPGCHSSFVVCRKRREETQATKGTQGTASGGRAKARPSRDGRARRPRRAVSAVALKRDPPATIGRDDPIAPCLRSR